jgi:hypothetical protein
MLFIESKNFETRRSELLTVDEFKKLKNVLCQFPTKGVVIPGTGGLRKLRVSSQLKGKGKRGGCRLLYLNLPEVDHLHLLYLFSKNEKEDLSPSEKKILKHLVKEIKNAARKP